MTLAFILVNYNNSDYSINAIDSILKIKEIQNFIIIIVDNSSIYCEKEKLKIFRHKLLLKESLKLIFLDENIGYFRGLNVGLMELKADNTQNYDYVVVGNNDLLFSLNFLVILKKNNYRNFHYPVIAPNIITLEGIHQNPHVIKKLSCIRKLIYELYFKHYLISVVMMYIRKLMRDFAKRGDSKLHNHSGVIHMGYGACYILTNEFFKHFSLLDAPTFLMGEEAFLSSQIHSKNLEMFYDSELVVHHIDHASINKMPSKKMWCITRDAYEIYKKYL